MADDGGQSLEDASDSSNDAIYSAFNSGIAMNGFEKLDHETNITFELQVNLGRAASYDHATCEMTFEIRADGGIMNWVQLKTSIE